MLTCCFGRKKSSKEDIIDISWASTTPFVPPITNGKVIKVYDGDTITIASKLPYDDSPMYRFSVRLNGIDCPEIKGKSETEKEIAVIAKTKLSDMILNKNVCLQDVKTEKYGRVLADVYYNGLNLNTWLVEQKLAVSYDGGTKITPECWKKYYESGIHHHKYSGKL